MLSHSLRHIAPLRAKRVGLRAHVTKWLEMRQTRAALARLDPHLLRDIGLDSARATAEARRTF
ncbi:DUF1127 domain-containing protein [Sedimentimonas flavescens]|uniref:DUF1127 domain-containing protein n=1 Tax=Sedimentimonas flavescens TaxID=2851012 RepID=UPI001C4A284A|nr:DUF1127 domain-containing protein [Sedimentimonas flavescens]MBW0159154.1 DUF1127 domain-containing protein [Sedimentimonas flavescens]